MGLPLELVCFLTFVIGCIGLIAWASNRSKTPPQQRGRYRSCPACDSPVFSNEYECSQCELDLYGALAGRLDRVRIARREVRLLRDYGQLDSDTAGRVDEQLGLRKEHLLDPAWEPVRRERPTEKTPVPPEPAAAPPPAAEEPEPVIFSDDEPSTGVVPTPEPYDFEPEPPPRQPEPVLAAEKAPRRSLAEVLGRFMHERNILWGELAGGLLIVGCSIALVVSLWRTLESLPYFTFLLSSGITAAIFGAGYYTFHHWRLKGTSRGLLAIALLLMPLNLLLLADPGSRGVMDATDLLVKIAGVVVFAWLARTGARDLVGADSLAGVPARWLFALAVVGAPATQILPELVSPTRLLHLPIWLSLGCFAAAFAGAIGWLNRSQRRPGAAPLREDSASAALAFLGLAFFALCAVWALAVGRSDDLPTALRQLALPVVVAGMPILATGLLIHRRLTEPVGLRTTGTGTAGGGMVVLLAGLALAWPDPLILTVTAATVAAAVGWFAFRDGLPWLYAGAIPAGALAFVLGIQWIAVGWHVPTGGDPGKWLTERLISAPAGAALAGFALLLGGVSEMFARSQRMGDARGFALGAAGVAATGLILITLYGAGWPTSAAASHLVVAAGFIAASFRWRYHVVAQVGAWLLLPTTLWWLYAVIPDVRAVWALVVAGEAVALALFAIVLRHSDRLAGAFRDVAGAGAILSLGLALVGGAFPDAPELTAILLLGTTTALILAGLYRQPALSWVAAVIGPTGLAHLFAFRFGLEPASAAILLALLTHATLVMGAARLIGTEGARLFAEPLRQSGRLATCFAVALLLFPVSGLAVAWVGFAVWTGLLWLEAALVGRERWAFPMFQGTLTWAAGLAGFAWVVRQDWFLPSQYGAVDYRAVQTYGVAVALLSIGWGVARWGLRNSETAKRLWSDLTPSLDRLVLGGLVIGSLAFAAWGVFPAVAAELTAKGAASSFGSATQMAHLWGSGMWLLAGLLGVALAVSLRTGEGADRDASVIGLTLLALTVPFLAAGRFAPELASASALRWGFGAVFLLGSGLVASREWLSRVGPKVSPWVAVWARGLLAAGASIVVLITARVAALGLAGQAPSGPAAGSVFHQMGWTLSAIGPLAMVVVGLAWTAVRERSSGYAYAGGWVWVVTLAGGYALGVVTAGGSLGPAELTRVGLIAVGAAAVWSLAWLGIRRRVPDDGLLVAHITTALVGLSVICVAPLARMLANPGSPLGLASARLGVEGWPALLAVFAGAFWRATDWWRPQVIGWTALVGGILAACSVVPWGEPGIWLSSHVLLATWAVAGAALAAHSVRRRTESEWPLILAVGLALFGLRMGWSDPMTWVPPATLTVAAVLVGVRAFLGQARPLVYLSGLLTVLASALAWVAWGTDTPANLALSAAVGFAVAGAAWAILRPDETESKAQALPPFPLLAGSVSLGLLAVGVIPTLAGSGLEPATLVWGALASVAVVLALLPRQGESMVRPCGLYAVGALAVGLAVVEFRSGPVWLDWLTPPALAAFVLAVSAAATGRHLRSNTPESDVGFPVWLLIAQAITGTLVLGMAVRTSVGEPELAYRLLAPVAGAALVVAAALLLPGSGRWAPMVRRSALILVVVPLGLLAWAIPDPADGYPWLHRQAGLFMALTLISATYLSLRFGSPSPQSAGGRGVSEEYHHVGSVTAAVALAVLGGVLVQQIPIYDPVTKTTPLVPLAIGGVLAGILTLMILSLRTALRPDRDPLGPTSQGRTGYVYLAEILVVLAFAHLKLNVPELFSAAAVRYWTFIVMVLAFVGVGVAEMFARRQLTVLSKPLLRTGVLLPLIPLLAFWAKPPQVLLGFADDRAPGLRPMLGYLEHLPQHFDNYAVLWFLAGLLYGMIALSRRSFGWALLGALAANAGVWALLTHHQVPAAVHPQAWAIPLALIVLISEHVNRHRLRPDVSSGLRYLGISMIYVASAADLFIAGVGQSLWLPVILAALCLVGVAGGVLLRVRAFLYLGVGFLFLDVFAMIWHAAVDQEQTWVWYVSGIVLGVAILALFAVLEKRQNDVRELVERLRQWK